MRRSEREAELGDLYLSLLKRTLTFSLWGGVDGRLFSGGSGAGWRGFLYRLLEKRGFRLSRVHSYSAGMRDVGGDCPALADTMIGSRRIDNLHRCVESVLEDDVPGDLIEAGVWRGGAAILMRAVLNVWGVTDRKVFVADSFQGLPEPTHAADLAEKNVTSPALAVSLEQVKANFQKYGLLDDQVVFLKGWFKDTLPSAPFENVAVARIDGDLYESTRDALTALYPKLSPGGFLIVDDYGALQACRKAVDEYRDRHGINEPIQDIDGIGVFWRREAGVLAR
jgi:O-methyltransferase